MKTISIKWSTDDVMYQAESMGITLTEEQADTILDNVERFHDANEGINWVVIGCHIDNFMEKQI